MSAEGSPALEALVALIDRDGTTALGEKAAGPGAGSVAPHVLQTMLDGALADGSVTAGAGRDTLERIAALHRRQLEGKPVAEIDWREVRRAALDAADTTSGPDQLLARIAEAGAWPLAGSRSLLVDVFQARLAQEQARRDAILGWGAAEADEAYACLDAISQRLEAETGEVDRTRIPELFAQEKPELEARFREQLAASNTAFFDLAGVALATMERLFAATGKEDQAS